MILKTAVQPKETKEAKDFEGLTQTRPPTYRVNGSCLRTSFLSAFFVSFGHPTAGLRMMGLKLTCAAVWMFGLIAVAPSARVAAEDLPVKTMETGSTSVQASQEIQLRGRVVCLAEEMHRLYRADLPTNHSHVYGFRTEDGKYFTLLRTKYSEALFTDKRLHEKDLLLKGQTFPGTQVFEPIILRSVQNGVVNDLIYYCAVCEIFSVAPGICDCCQDPTELVEKPLAQKRPAIK